MKSRKSVKKSRAQANVRAAVEAEQMRSHDPAADQHHELLSDLAATGVGQILDQHYDGSAAANHQDLDLGDKDIANLAKTSAHTNRVSRYLKLPSAHFDIKADGEVVERIDAAQVGYDRVPTTTPEGWTGHWQPEGHLYSSGALVQDEAPKSKGFNFSPERGWLTDVPDFPLWQQDDDGSKGVPQFVTDLEAAIEAADITDVPESASEIAAELLKHPALQGYLDIGELANGFVPDCEYQNAVELDDPEQAHSEQFQRYAPHFDIAKSAGGSLDQHFDVETNEKIEGFFPGMHEIINATAKAFAADLTEQEFLGNETDAEQVLNGDVPPYLLDGKDTRTPQLMAIARAGITALQELAGMAAEHKGFHEDRPVAGPELTNWQGNKLMLIVSEVVEAHDEIRSGQKAWNTYYPTMPETSDDDGTLYKPEGVPSEIADVVIRASDFAWTEGFDLADIIIEKLEYNATRGHKHGKQF